MAGVFSFAKISTIFEVLLIFSIFGEGNVSNPRLIATSTKKCCVKSWNVALTIEIYNLQFASLNDRVNATK